MLEATPGYTPGASTQPHTQQPGPKAQCRRTAETKSRTATKTTRQPTNSEGKPVARPNRAATLPPLDRHTCVTTVDAPTSDKRAAALPAIAAGGDSSNAKRSGTGSIAASERQCNKQPDYEQVSHPDGTGTSRSRSYPSRSMATSPRIAPSRTLSSQNGNCFVYYC